MSMKFYKYSSQHDCPSTIITFICSRLLRKGKVFHHKININKFSGNYLKINNYWTMSHRVFSSKISRIIPDLCPSLHWYILFSKYWKWDLECMPRIRCCTQTQGNICVPTTVWHVWNLLWFQVSCGLLQSFLRDSYLLETR